MNITSRVIEKSLNNFISNEIKICFEMYQRFTSILDHEHLVKSDSTDCWTHEKETKDLLDDIVDQMSTLTKTLALLKRRYNTSVLSRAQKCLRRYKSGHEVCDGEIIEEIGDCQ